MMKWSLAILLAAAPLAGQDRARNDGRDRKMHKSVLESDRFPEIVFRPGRLEGRLAATGSSKLELAGQVGIHGVEREVSIPVLVESSGSGYRVTGEFSVPYVKWGMKDPSTLFLRVSDHVEIAIQAVAESH